ncbi:phosphatase PAP2 family protein [Acinetobacter tianfuensis]|uniref:undecaprenyl-diphosphate phosphatase n=1 Tax=Acinetobacter tianfuensis TaxID=2419603 RepID=A0A3A8EWJ8_9GAMM|nr:phosphatase PAP2 family protein [Acinetobacter tianfuensis]RKG32803.1 phosphatase PAP2 family protein [Acinetobacter tianfuensis]
MPKRLLFLGCFMLIFSILLLIFPTLNRFDLSVLDWMHAHRNAAFNTAAIGFSIAGGMPFVLFITTLWCLQSAWYKKYSLIAFISIGILGSISLTWLLKYLISRPRPPEMYFLVNTYGDSFPSGHSLYAAALGCLGLYIYQQYTQRKLIYLFICTWVLLMGFSRVYAGAHYPSDVLSGWGISLIWITFLYAVLNKQQLRKLNNEF